MILLNFKQHKRELYFTQQNKSACYSGAQVMSLPNKKGKLLKGRLLAAPLAILLLSASGCATTQEAELHEAVTKSISVSQKQAIESKII